MRYSYLKDETVPGRVLSIAREFDKETKTVKFGWSLNNPPHWTKVRKVTTREISVAPKAEFAKYYEGKPSTKTVSDVSVELVKVKGDIFSRKQGRALAVHRLETDPLVTRISNDEEVPLKAVLSYLVNEGTRLELPYHVVDIARQHLDSVPSRSELWGSKSHPSNGHEPKKSFLDKFVGWMRG